VVIKVFWFSVFIVFVQLFKIEIKIDIGFNILDPDSDTDTDSDSALTSLPYFNINYHGFRL